MRLVCLEGRGSGNETSMSGGEGGLGMRLVCLEGRGVWK